MHYAKGDLSGPSGSAEGEQPYQATCACGARHLITQLPKNGKRFAAHCRRCGELFFVGEIAPRDQQTTPPANATVAPIGYEQWISRSFQREPETRLAEMEPPVMLPQITALEDDNDMAPYAETVSASAVTKVDLPQSPATPEKSVFKSAVTENDECALESIGRVKIEDSPRRALSRGSIRRAGSTTPMVQRRQSAPLPSQANAQSGGTRAPTSMWSRPMAPLVVKRTTIPSARPPSAELVRPSLIKTLTTKECLVGAAMGIAVGATAALFFWFVF
jgi:hypothetical protein